MVRPGATEQGVERAAPSSVDYRSAAPQLRAARIGIQIALVVAVVEGFLSLVAGSVTGWGIGIDPAGSAAPLGQLNVSAGVADLLGRMMVTAAAGWVVLVLTLVAAGITVLRWQTAAVTNLAALGHSRPGHAPWTAAAAWLVPVWSLFGPLLTFVDLWHSSDPAAPDQPDRSAPRSSRIPALHGGWWALWLGAVLLSALSMVRMSRSPTLGTLLTEQLTQVVIDGALVGAGFMLLRILTQTTARQEARAAARTP